HQTGATINVYGNSSTGVISGNTSNGETFSGTPTSGSAPLTVTFSGIVNGNDQGWCANGCSDILVLGDGSQAAVPLPSSQSQAQNYSLQHTYTGNGTYTAILYQGQAAAGRPTIGQSITITVGGGGNTSTGSSSTYNPPSVTPGVGGNPLA